MVDCYILKTITLTCINFNVSGIYNLAFCIFLKLIYNHIYPSHKVPFVIRKIENLLLELHFVYIYYLQVGQNMFQIMYYKRMLDTEFEKPMNEIGRTTFWKT